MKLEKKIEEQLVFSVWNNKIDKKIQTKTTPYYFHNKELYVLVCNSLWLHYVTLEKEKLLKILKKNLGNDFIKNIRFKLDFCKKI